MKGLKRVIFRMKKWIGSREMRDVLTVCKRVGFQDKKGHPGGAMRGMESGPCSGARFCDSPMVS